MLQQTQVKTVIPYFNRFIERFPDIKSLALASEEAVLALWSGLGYYSRARHLHRTANILHAAHLEELPSDLSALIQLPGIGPSTAAAIASLAYEKPTAILDGNVKRVLSRYFLIHGHPNERVTHNKLWDLARACMPEARCRDYTQAIMDLGATCCTLKNPGCDRCPLQTTCRAKAEDAVANYPTQVAKKSRPTRYQQFLVLHTDDRTIYLEKRSNQGIWGGLWCLPSIDMEACPATYVLSTHQLKPDKAIDLLSLKHDFTHFRLMITVRSLRIAPSPPPGLSSSARWVSLEDLPHLGLAKPVDTIIQFFFNQ